MISHSIVYDADERNRAIYSSGIKDFLRGVRLAELWLAMGWHDIRQRYSRSVMGPFWVSISLGVFVIGLGLTYGALFRAPVRDYVPYVTVGMVVWTMIAAMVNEGCMTFISAASIVKQMPAPASVHALRVVWRSLIIFAHNAAVIVLMLLVLRVNPGWAALLAIPGLAVLLLNGVGFCVTLGILATRFRDVTPLVGNLIQMLLFVTPVLWRASDLGDRGAIALANPFFHLIELVRSPLLGAAPTLFSWQIALIFTALNLCAALFLYAHFRWRIPYWI
ncbi:ABC transporter permease [Terrarubrum flagellatum]|uniref:ABC transporter permease n=1 Tax=Terrirubrum flagellatum TaxID=2895980 RepID=UPI0031456E4A